MRPISPHNFSQRVDALTTRVEELARLLRRDAHLLAPSDKRVNTIRLRNLRRAASDLTAVFNRPRKA